MITEHTVEPLRSVSYFSVFVFLLSQDKNVDFFCIVLQKYLIVLYI